MYLVVRGMINHFDKIPNEVLQIILIDAILSSEFVVLKCQTCENILKTCTRFKIMIKEEGKLLLPRIHILPDKDLLSGPSYNRKIKVSVRKITRAFGNSSGLSMDLSRLIGDRKWKSAWLNIVPGRNS